MTVATDTNILIDILLPDPLYQEGSLELLSTAAKTDRLIISEVVYGELATQFPGKKFFAQFLKDTDFHLVNTSPEALWITAGAWKAYLKNRDRALQCSKCGKKLIPSNPTCLSPGMTPGFILMSPLSWFFFV